MYLAPIVWTLAVSLLVVSSDASRILGFFPFEGRSQHHVFAAVLHGLAQRGHQVVYLTPVKPALTHPNLEVRLKPSFVSQYEEAFAFGWATHAPLFLVNLIFYNGVSKLAEHMYGDAVTQSVIHSNESFDAVLIESFILQEPVSALLHKFGCVAIEVSTLGDSSLINEFAGLPDNLSYQMNYNTPLTDSMSFWERIYNSYATFSFVAAAYLNLWRQQRVMDSYFNYSGWETRPSLGVLASNRSLILVNRDITLDYPFPQPPHVREIGGINIHPPKPLPKDLQDFMDRAKEGVIYFSLGTHLKTTDLMSSEVGKALMPVFRKLKQKILMKWESEERPDFPANIKTYKWMPQQSVLAHNNCVLFISHGGLLSLTEAVFNSVPVVGIPHFVDQPKNMLHAEHYGYGIYLRWGNITQESVGWAIGEVLDNPRYREAARKRSQLLRDKRHSPVEEAVYWVEYVIRYPGALTPKGAFLNFFLLHAIDITLFWIFIIFLSYKMIKIVLKALTNNIPKSKKEKVH